MFGSTRVARESLVSVSSSWDRIVVRRIALSATAIAPTMTTGQEAGEASARGGRHIRAA